MRRATVVLAKARLFRRRVAEAWRSLQGLVNQLLRQAFTVTPRPAYKLKLHGWEAREQPGVDVLDRDKLFDLMDGP